VARASCSQVGAETPPYFLGNFHHRESRSRALLAHPLLRAHVRYHQSDVVIADEKRDAGLDLRQPFDAHFAARRLDVGLSTG
jgi:hypothetical protein